MTLEGTNCINPRLYIHKVHGAGLRPELLEQHLIRFEYIDEPKRRPHVSLTFENEDGAIMNLATIIMGLKMQVSWGYETLQTEPLMDIIVHRIRGNMVRPLSSGSQAPDKPRPYGKSGRSKQGGSRFSSAGVIEMDAAISAPTLRKTVGKNKAVYKNMRMHEIVKHIALTNGFSEKSIIIQNTMADGTQEPALSEVQLREHLSVEQFLADEAYQRGYVFRMHGGQFYWGAEDLAPSHEEDITYFEGPDLLSFEIDGDFRTNVSRAKARGLDPKNREIVSYSGKTDALSFGFVQGPLAWSQRDSINVEDVATTITNKKELKTLGRLVEHAKNKWLVKLTVVGNPRIFAGKLINLDNFGPLIDGAWRVRGCRHILDDTGYTTTTDLISADKRLGRCGPMKEITSYNTKTGKVSFGFVGVPCAAQKKKNKRRGGRKAKDPTPIVGNQPVSLGPEARNPRK